jgi:hypothetical protein
VVAVVNVGFALVILSIGLFVLRSVVSGLRRRLVPAVKTGLPSPPAVEAAGGSLEDGVGEAARWVPAAMHMDGMEHPVTVKSMDRCGCFLLFPQPPPPGRRLTLRFSCCGGETLHLAGEVLWSNSAVPEELVLYRGMKVRFQIEREGDRKTLESLLQKPREPLAESPAAGSFAGLVRPAAPSLPSPENRRWAPAVCP